MTRDANDDAAPGEPPARRSAARLHRRLSGLLIPRAVPALPRLAHLPVRAAARPRSETRSQYP
ncbi:protein of unknown function [Blastococcus saxobsidens DD2]|uniref:Uncharacterized protein n=1 Tax=Blastococcus saxobsidens (strain DD2) TaxID=1146883 RepID=H6RVD7_BLASD|nr:protein of unknown function [Blastococcus saxobsidens DD2]